MFRCFWCQNEFPLEQKTRDHLIPKSCGGGGCQKDNIRDSCGKCNNERGILPGHHGNYRYILRKLSIWQENHPDAKTLYKWLQRVVSRYNNRSGEIQKLLEKWVALETERLGRSPSADIPFVWVIRWSPSPCVVQSTPVRSTPPRTVICG